MAPFYGWISTASRLESLRGGSLLFTTTFYQHKVAKQYIFMTALQKDKLGSV